MTLEELMAASALFTRQMASNARRHYSNRFFAVVNEARYAKKGSLPECSESFAEYQVILNDALWAELLSA